MFSSNASQVSAANYIEDVFSTYLYTGTGAALTITNNIDTSTYGGLVWLKRRSTAADNLLFDTNRGATQRLWSNLTLAQAVDAQSLTSFNTTGFSLGTDSTGNQSGGTYASWTFRKQAKFFDVVTYTGNGNNGTAVISHSLGSVPGCIIIKKTSTSSDWYTYHRSLNGGTNAYQYGLFLNTTAAVDGPTSTYHYAAPTSTNFYPNSLCNSSGATYVAYLFAHDAGGFGASGSDNVISCGSFTTDGSGNVNVNLGYEPQYLLIKSTSAGNWLQMDSMRGFGASYTAILFPNLSSAEDNSWTPPTAGMAVNSTGFNGGSFGANVTYIYIAIRRGPMKKPTSGTSVFSAKTYVGTTTSAEVTHDVTFDVEINANRTSSVAKFLFVDSLRGINGTVVYTSTTGPENSYPTYWSRKSQRTMYAPSAFDDWWSATSTNQNHISYGLVRAPGFFDEVCYTGTGASATLNHNLGVAPNMVIIKGRTVVSNWETYLSSLGGTIGNGLSLNNPGAKTGTPPVSSATATTFTLNNGVSTSSGQTYVAYLFATLTGVSKVGSYTGTAALQTIDCGFSAGARFVLIKRTDSTGDWYVWDSARGISSGNDPYLLWNSNAAEVTTTNYVDTTSVGFQVTAAAPAALNASGGTYIFLAIA